MILPLGMFLMAVSSLDPMVDWTVLRARLALRPPSQISFIFTLLFVSWSMAAGRALRPVWRQPAVSFLLRQPVGGWFWIRHLLIALWVVFPPLGVMWWLAPHYVNPAIHYLGFVGLSWSIFLGASFRGFAAFKYIAMGTIAVAALVYGYALYPGTAYLALLVSILLLPLSAGGIRDQLVQSRSTKPRRLRSRWPVIAIVRRDLLCLWRTERKTLLGLLVLGLAAALMMLAARVNGQVAGRSAFLFSCGLFSVSVIPLYELLTRLKSRLGPELFRQRWPVSRNTRGVALLVLAFVLSSPGAIVLVCLGATMGPGYGLLFVLFAATTGVGLTALFSRTLISAVPMLGWSLWLLFIHAILVIGLTPWVYVPIAAIFLSFGVFMTLKGLQMFTHQTEFGNLDQFA